MSWLSFAEITAFEVSDHARLEASAALHAVDAPTGGTVVAVHAILGEEVEAGALLIELESEHQEGELREVEALLAAKQQQLTSTRREIDLIEGLLDDARATARRRLVEAEARREVDDIEARFAETERNHSERLHELGLMSDIERLRLEGKAKKTRAEADMQGAAVASLEAEQQEDETTLMAQRVRLDHEVTRTAGDAAALEARGELLRHEIEDRHVRAPVAGRIGRLGGQRVGSVVHSGERLVELVPAGGLHAVAFFAPGVAGRLRPGQKARLRLDAFPWTEFGALSAIIERVAGEAEKGRLRVEMALDITSAPPAALQHGLTGTAEVEVERLSPARWILRAAGAPLRAVDGS